MCTVLFIPGKSKLNFVSLRDENPTRPAAGIPEFWEQTDVKFMAPKDKLAGGTWIGTNELNTVIILLNGGFENHQRSDHYIRSRGIIVTELLGSLDPINDWGKMKLINIEPFTLIIWSNLSLYQLVWDGIHKHSISLNPSLPYLFSSSTLYNSESKKIREDLFENWMIKKPEINVESVLDFFKTYPDSFNGFIMNRNEEIKTLSYSFIEITNNDTATMYYQNFKNGTFHRLTLEKISSNPGTFKYSKV